MASPPEVIPLITLEEARGHLRIDGETESPLSTVDQVLTLKILQASHIVTDYIKRPDNGWDDFTAPPLIKAAVMLVLNIIYDHPEADPLTVGVKSILHRYRDPAIA